MPITNNDQPNSVYGLFRRLLQRLPFSIGLRRLTDPLEPTGIESVLSLPRPTIIALRNVTRSARFGIFEGMTGALSDTGTLAAEVYNQSNNMQLALPLSSTNASQLEIYPEVVIPEDFKCVISREIMTNPVYDPKYPQQKFDLLILILWLEQYKTHPCSRTPLLAKDLEYDEPLKLQIDDFVDVTLNQNRLSFSG